MKTDINISKINITADTVLTPFAISISLFIVSSLNLTLAILSKSLT